MAQRNDPNLVAKALAKAQSVETRLNALAALSIDPSKGVNVGGGTEAGLWVGPTQMILANATHAVGVFAPGVGVRADSAHIGSAANPNLLVDSNATVGGTLTVGGINVTGGGITTTGLTVNNGLLVNGNATITNTLTTAGVTITGGGLNTTNVTATGNVSGTFIGTVTTTATCHTGDIHIGDGTVGWLYMGNTAVIHNDGTFVSSVNTTATCNTGDIHIGNGTTVGWLYMGNNAVIHADSTFVGSGVNIGGGTVTAGVVNCNSSTMAGLTINGGGTTTTNLTVTSAMTVRGGIPQMNGIQPYSGGLVAMYYNATQYAGYWDSQGVHVGALYGSGGVLTSGDNLRLKGSANSIPIGRVGKPANNQNDIWNAVNAIIDSLVSTGIYS